MTGTESADDLMLEVMNALRESGKVPTAGIIIPLYITLRHLIFNMIKTL